MEELLEDVMTVAEEKGEEEEATSEGGGGAKEAEICGCFVDTGSSRLTAA